MTDIFPYIEFCEDSNRGGMSTVGGCVHLQCIINQIWRSLIQVIVLSYHNISAKEAIKIHMFEVSELFFDLVFVTAVSAINDDLREEELSFGNYFQYFLVIWFFWKEITLYGSLLASDDLWHKLYFGA